MKKAIISLIFFWLIPTCQAQEGAVTVSFIWGVMSRGGLMVGYNITDDVAIEAHLGGAPHTYTYGVTTKIRLKDRNTDHFALVGLTRVWSGYPKRESVRATGINLGYRFEFNTDRGDVSYPLEFGICPLLTKKVIPSDQEEEESDTDPPKADPNTNSPKNEPDGIPLTGFLGVGVQWSSK